MKTKLRKFLSVSLTTAMMFCMTPFTATVTKADEPESQQIIAQETVNGSAILHCWNWSFDSIRENLPAIAGAGYTAVQTSPIQPPKDYGSTWTDVSGQWWKLYQPLGLRIADENESWLGSKTELTRLCEEADTYGIKVIVDIVANHVANNGTSGGTYSLVNENVDANLKKSEYYHDHSQGISDDSRFTITQYHMGMPDLNTANSTVQNITLEFLKDCVDSGVDGFRFDAAKHIEVPSDEGCGSNFWPTVISGINDYAASKGILLYNYGEILGGAGTDISNYTAYMAVTDNETGNNALSYVVSRNAEGLKSSYYHKGTSAENCVLWAESHDTYIGGDNSRSKTDDQIVKTWAIVGARADSTSLFFARPDIDGNNITNPMGAASKDNTWKSTAVAEINKFKNAFDGQSEYLSSLGKTAYIERGTKGVSISKLDGGGSVSLTAHTMADGLYTDQVSGNLFVVSNGTISGTVGSTGVAVVYNPDDVDDTAESLTDTVYLDPGVWDKDNARFAMWLFGGTTSSDKFVSMTSAGNGKYVGSISGDYTKVIFCRMNGSTTSNSWDNKWNQSSDLSRPSEGGDTLYIVTGWNEGDGYWSGNCTHTYSGVSQWIWGGTSSAVAEFDCTICSHKEYVAADTITRSAGTDFVNYTASVTFNGQSYTNVNELVRTENSKLYFTPDTSWTTGARFAVYVWTGDNSAWHSLSASETAGTYYVDIPNLYDYENAIFCSMYSSSTENNWENKIKQTADLVVPIDGKNLFTYTDDQWSVYVAPEPTDEYTIIWVNDDNTVLATSSAAEGVTPVYPDEAPAKSATPEYSYTFTGWTPQIVPAEGNATYTATYSSTDVDYYLTGSFNSWNERDADYKLERNTKSQYTAEYMIRHVQLAAGTTIKVTNTNGTWYPGAVGYNFEIPFTGVYNIYVNPYYGYGALKDGFIEGSFYVESVNIITYDSDGGNAVDESEIVQRVIASSYAPTMSGSVPAPTKTGYKFVKWVDDNGNDYDFENPSAKDVTLHATWTENKVQITFTDNNNIVTTKDLGVMTEIAEAMPKPIYLDGYNFEGWTINNGETLYTTREALIEAVNAAINDPDNPQPVSVKVNYGKDETRYLVTVEGGILPQKTEGNPSKGMARVSDVITVEANAPESGMKFDHWTKNGVIVSYDTTYKFRMPAEEVIFVANYVSSSTTVTPEGTAYIESVKSPAANKLAFVAICSIPDIDGYEWVAGGIVATNKASIGGNVEIGNCDFYKVASVTNSTTRNLKYTWTKSKVSADDTWYVKPYVIYKDANGDSHTVYGDVVAKKLKDGNVVIDG